MYVIKDSIRIEASPKDVFNWFCNRFTKDYKDWHVGDHILAKWAKGSNFNPGSILYAEEYLGKKIVKLRFKIVEKKQDKSIKYKLFFPRSLISPGGGFTFKECNGGSIFTATFSFRFGHLLSKIMPTKTASLKKHMKEEGENLKKILEN